MTRKAFPFALLCAAYVVFGSTSLHAQNIFLAAANPTAASPGVAISVTAANFVAGQPVGPAIITLTPQFVGPVLTAIASVQGTGTARSINYIQPVGAAGLYTLSIAASGLTSSNTLTVTILGPASFTLNPTSGTQGASIPVTITGSNTSFPSGTTASFGPGISVGGAAEGTAGPVVLQPNGTAIANLIINPEAATGTRTVQVNGLDSVTQSNAFTVLQRVRTLTLVSVTPASGPANTAATISASGFELNVAAPPMVVTLVPQAGGAPILVAATAPGLDPARSVSFTVPAGTLPGAYNVTVGGTNYISGSFVVFTVTTPGFSLNPASGAQGATVQVTLTGANTSFPIGSTTANFGPGISVGGAPANTPGPVAVQGNGTAIATLTIAPGATLGARSVQVIGANSITQANAFTVTPSVTTLTLITSNPSSGPPTTAVSITATGFIVNDNPTLTVTLTPNGGGSPVTAVTTIQGSTANRTVNFVLPAGTSPGAYTVTLAGPGYVSGNSLPFTVTGPPSFTLSPISGNVGTTVQVTITGANTSFPSGNTTANFGPGISVGGAAEGAFGPVAVQPNGTAIATLTINAGATLGGRTVQVSGLATISQANAFTVTQTNTTLTLISINPGSAPPTSAVSITATGFIVNDTPTLTVTLTPNGGGSPVTAPTTIQGLAANRTINFILPAGTPVGAYTVTVAGPGYVSANSLPFTVTTGPGFTLNPNSSNVGTTVQVTIIGTNTTFPGGNTTANFGPGISVGGAAEGAFGPVAVQPNGTAIASLIINSGATVGPRTVQVNGLDALTQANAFTVTAGPAATITGVNPASAQQGQTLALTITGSNTHFTAQSTVSLGANITVNSVVRNSDTSLTANISIAANAALGLRDVVVTTDGTPLTGSGLFTVTLASPIQLISAIPGTGKQGSTLSVVITGSGTHFAAGSTVTFGSGVTVNSVTFSTATSLTANISIDPNATVGSRTVTVTTGQEVVAGVGLFTVQALPAQILSINPTSGQQGQTLNVAINGTDFRTGATASFGAGVTVNSVAFNGPTSLTANISIAPGAALGTRTVTVTSNGLPVTLPDAFTVVSGTPRLLTISPNSILQGQTLTFAIAGEFTTFQQGVTQVSLGQGVTIATVSVTSPTTLSVTAMAAADATLGARSLTGSTGSQVVTLANAVTIAAPTGPAILSVTPNSAQQGQSLNVAIVGTQTNFVQGNAQVSFGAGITVNSVIVSGPTTLSASISVAPQATVGGRTVTVTTGAGAISLANGFFVVSSVQNEPLTCTSNAGVPPLLRSEGFTELTGDILIVCTGGTAGETSNINLQLFLNVPVTSRLIGGQSEALLLVDELGINVDPGPATPARYQALAAQGENSLVWPNVAFTAPGAGNQRILRFTNVRANVTSLAASASVVPSQVFAFLSVSPSQSLPLRQAQQAVGFVLPGLAFDVTNCNGSATVSNAFAQCVAENAGGNRNLIGGTTGNIQFGVRFTEGFQTAFKNQLAPNQLPSVPGMVYNSESGFLGSDLPFAVGGADTGTRLVARFNNVPNGVRLFVTTRPSFGSTGGLDAILVQAGANAAGGTVQPGAPIGISGTATLFCPLTSAEGIPAAEIPVTNNSAMAVWEVTSANMAALESVVFGVAVAYTPDTPNQRPGLGQASVSGNFGPFYSATSDAARMSASLPIPRFLDAPTIKEAFRIDTCVTNLLFPFVTNQAGFDTGIAISNTSMDPFGSPQRQQAGACTVNYFGSTSGGPAPPAQRTTSPVASGSHMAFVLSSGGSHGVAPTPGFQGYLIVQCDFRYGHGFAFVTDGPIGSARVAEGYLGLVMDAGVQSRGSASETLSH